MSSTTTATLIEPPKVAASLELPTEGPTLHPQSETVALESLGGPEPDAGEETGELTNVSRIQQRWNSPKGNTWKIAAVFLAFFNSGVNDASYGVCPSNLSRTSIPE